MEYITKNAVIYDCDGTLIDSESIVSTACVNALHAVGYPLSVAEFDRRFTGLTSIRTWEILRAEIPFVLPEGFNDAINAEIYHKFAHELQPVTGVFDVIPQMSARRAVASSTRLPQLRKNLEVTKLISLFEPHIYSASQVARAKPAPDVFLLAASQMGADPQETIVIEDSATGVNAARRAGMRVIGFVGVAHDPEERAEALRKAGAFVVIDDMFELMKVMPQD